MAQSPSSLQPLAGSPIDMPHFAPPSREMKKKEMSLGCGYFTMKVIVALCDGTPSNGVAVSNMV
jgi:hypothetical protein